MRLAWYAAAAAAALAAAFTPETLRIALATAASALLEAAPFLLAGALASVLLRQCDAPAYLGCGCAGGPSARSLPAAVATWLAFGPAIALARLAAAIAVARLVLPRAQCCPGRPPARPLAALAALVPAALLAGLTMQVSAMAGAAKLSPAAAAIAGALLGFAASPCGLGVVSLAGALRATAPAAAIGFLCVAGIADLRAFARREDSICDDDGLAYALLACALGIVAVRRGDALVHPAFTPAFAVCAAAALGGAVARRRHSNPSLRLAPALMLAGALVAAPPPVYRATETTLTDLFPGERVAFTGRLWREGARATLVRYAITCCRADAAPVALRLLRVPRFLNGSWLRADGQIVAAGGDQLLDARRVVAVAPPSDPFIYR